MVGTMKNTAASEVTFQSDLKACDIFHLLSVLKKLAALQDVIFPKLLSHGCLDGQPVLVWQGHLVSLPKSVPLKSLPALCKIRLLEILRGLHRVGWSMLILPEDVVVAVEKDRFEGGEGLKFWESIEPRQLFVRPGYSLVKEKSKAVRKNHADTLNRILYN